VVQLPNLLILGSDPQGSRLEGRTTELQLSQPHALT
jgi:hypothetical protein